MPNEFKNQLSLKLKKGSVEKDKKDLAEIDKIDIVFLVQGTNAKWEKYIKGLSFNTYKVNLAAISVERSSTTKLQININDDSHENIGNSYSDPQAVSYEGRGAVVAKNLADEILVSWYLEPDEKGKFEALPGKNGVTERKLLELSSPDNQ